MKNNKNLNNYEVLCMGEKYYLAAQSWSVGTEGLKFSKNDEIVAWFTSWDYWMIIDED